MKAMILAAGLGTRLKPLTDQLPKALVPLHDKPMIEHLLQKLKSAGCNQIIINIHHHAGQIQTFLQNRKSDSLKITISHEIQLLDTGGGLKKAAWFFDDNQPFILHNVDVLSGIDLQKMVGYHQNEQADITLAVKSRQTSRYLLFDQNHLLIGHEKVPENKRELVQKEAKVVKRFSFLGIHVISPRVFHWFPEQDVFSIIDFYLLLAKQGLRIRAYPCEEDDWIDLGRVDHFNLAKRFLSG